MWTCLLCSESIFHLARESCIIEVTTNLDWRLYFLMIKDLYENEFSKMVGTFYSDVLGYDVEVWYDKNISQECVEKNIQYFNHLDNGFLESICIAIKRYYQAYNQIFPDLCDEIPESILADFEEEPTSILKYLSIGTYSLDEWNLIDTNIPVLHLSGGCAWSGDKGITIAAKNNQLLYVGPWRATCNIWNNSMKPSRLDEMFNYATELPTTP